MTFHDILQNLQGLRLKDFCAVCSMALFCLGMPRLIDFCMNVIGAVP